MTLYFPNHTITIYRRRRIGSADRYSMSATFTGYNTDIQPASAERQNQLQGKYGAMFTAFVEVDCEVKEGDQVVTEDGKRYSVKGVQIWQGAGLLDHKELVLVAQDA